MVGPLYARLTEQNLELLREMELRLSEEASDARTKMADRLLAVEMETRRLLSRRIYGMEGARHRPPSGTAGAASFEHYLEKFKALHPHLFEAWAGANFGRNVDEYRQRPECSCANDSRPDARLFSGFIAPYLSGRVLDVGCGPYAVPGYLKHFPLEQVSGLDPLEPFEAHPFEFVRGFAEFLPWPDNTFDVVIAATSLDHTLDLQLALSEMRRVLLPGGHLLVWEWFGESTEPYDPARKSPELVDRFHLFNFDEQWFEDLVSQHFSIAEKVRLLGEYFHYHFYALRLVRK
jgi:SAM-dependent methyltransferase